MKLPDQCPSTLKNGKAPEHARELISANGRAQWRSIEEFAGEPGFDEFVAREFPAGASELLKDSRRDFLKLMGASLALAGAATIPGCRRPNHKIMPYAQEVPEEVIPGQSLYYATSMALPGGGAEGLLVETHEARPTKIEGNPLHAYSNGRSSALAQASILQLYDPDRLVMPLYRGRGDTREATWDDFKAWAAEHFTTYRADGGSRLAFVVDKKSSPSRDAMRDRIRARFPSATWVAYNPVESTSAAEGSVIAFGSPMHEVLHLERAQVIVSLDRDFLDAGAADGLANARAFAASRRVNHSNEPMSRLYVFESMFSKTGGAADPRWRVAPSRIAGVAVALAREILSRRPVSGGDPLAAAVGRVNVPAGSDLNQAHISEVARDVLANANRTRTLIVAGPSQPAEVHALCHAMNAALENVGTTVGYRPMNEELASPSLEALAELASKMRAGEIETLVCIEANPVYDAPAGLGFAELYAHVAHTVCLSVGATETAAASEWSLNGAHYLEAWGDTEAFDGTIAPIQPMISPLFGDDVMSELELLAYLAGEERTRGYDIVRALWSERLGFGEPGDAPNAAFEKQWARALHDGVFSTRGEGTSRVAVRFGAVATSIGGLEVPPAPTDESLDVVFCATNVGDGRFANCGWLQELPQTGSMVCWDNPAYVSPKTADALGLLPTSVERIDRMYTKERYPQSRMATMRVDGRELTMAVWVVPGMADHTVVLPLGYGRTVCGRVGGDRASDYKVGFDTYRLKDASMTARRGTLTRVNKTYSIASTQTNWSMESRTSVVRAIDKKWWDQHAGRADKGQHTIYESEVSRLEAQNAGVMNLAERLGELSHMPPNTGIYPNPYNRAPDGEAGKGDAAPGSVFSEGPQWGMTIDLAACSGCGACTVACQSENNIPIVGKAEVSRGREMTWIRVDRYFTGDDTNAPDEMLHQPVACVQCENAPCETVCPVNATVHGKEGINYMVYNRCIGTRYCANNCPYKVRRFNFFDFGVKAYNGGYRDGIGEGVPKPDNINWIPPRLRKQLDEIEKLGKNPNVTVRSRGVMEKCTYCIQRINRARAETKLRDLKGVPDGFFQVACQQACPSEAIEFGNILDSESRVSKARGGDRSYLLLGYLNTRPRTSYLLKVRNPNAAIREYDHEDPLLHAGDHEGAPSEEGRAEEGGHAFIDPARTIDAGYSMSLKIIGVGGSA